MYILFHENVRHWSRAGTNNSHDLTEHDSSAWKLKCILQVSYNNTMYIVL